MTMKSFGQILLKFDNGWLDDEAVNLFVTLLNNYLQSSANPVAPLLSFFALGSDFQTVIVPDANHYDRNVTKALCMKDKGEKESATECLY